jgi:hypothetical protein
MSGGHRLHLRPPKEKWNDVRAWDEFNLACRNDTPLLDVIAMVNAMVDAGYTPLIVTGRCEIAEEPTHQWLEEHFPWYVRGETHFEMRDNNDCGTPVEVKIGKIKKLAMQYNVAFALDDDCAIVKALRDEGIQCFQVRNWQQNQ